MSPSGRAMMTGAILVAAELAGDAIEDAAAVAASTRKHIVATRGMTLLTTL